MNLSAAEQLIRLYEGDGNSTKAEIIRSKIAGLLH